MAQKATARQVEEGAGGQPSLEKARISDYLPDLRQGILEILKSGALAQKEEVVGAVCDAKRLELEDGQVIVDEAMYRQMLSAVGREYDEMEQKLKRESEKAKKEKAVVEIESIASQITSQLEKLREDKQKDGQSYGAITSSVGMNLDKLWQKLQDVKDGLSEAERNKLGQRFEKMERDFFEEKEKFRRQLAETSREINEAAAAVGGESVGGTRRAAEPSREEPVARQERARTSAGQERLPERRETRDIDLPSALLAEILEGREQELRRFMELMYKRALTEERGERVKMYLSDALQELFAKEPDEKIMGELKKHGIENWQNFCVLLKGPVGDKVNRVMNEMVQEQIKRDVAKNTKWYENIWAIKGQMATRILTNMTLVGGGVAIASFAATGIGGAALGIGAAAVGGGAGGLIRGLLQKYVFSKEKMEVKKKEKLTALAEKKQKEITKHLLEENFSETSDSEKTNKEVAAILAQVLREASVAEKSGESPVHANLDANAKRQYLDALRALNTENVEQDEKERQKIELMEVLSALQAKGEHKKVEAFKNADPVVVRILDGVMRGYTGTHEKAGVVSTSAIGAGVGIAFAASNEWARGMMGAIGGGLAGYQMAEKMRTRKGEEKALQEIQTELDSARVELGLLTKETEPDLQKVFFENLNFYVRKFRAAMRGGGEEAYASALKNNPMLRTQVENLIYESDKAVAAVESEQRKKMSALLESLEKEGEAVVKEAEKKSKIKNWFKKNAQRAAGFVIGAGVGAGIAVVLGEGIKEWRHILFGYHAPGIEPPHFETKTVHHVEPVAPKPELVEPAPVPKIRPVVEPTPVKPAVIAATVAAAEAAPAPRLGFDFADAGHDQKFIAFADEHNVTANEFGYVKGLTDKFPEINRSEALDKIFHSAEYHSGKHSAFPDVYKGTINTPIEAAADSRFSTFDAILKAGGVKRAVEFLKLQDFNDHDLRGNLKLTGSLDGQNLDNKLEELVKAYQDGDNKSGKHLFDAFRHDQNRVIAQYEDAKGIVRIKGVGGHDPRVLGGDDFHDNKLLVGQARGYGKLATSELPKVEYVPSARTGQMFEAAESDEIKIVKVSSDLENVLKARAGKSAYFQETIKQPDGRVVEYHVSNGEVVGYDVTADLATAAQTGVAEAGVEAGSAAAMSAAEQVVSSHTPRPVPISELWSQSKGGGGGGGGAGGSGASGGGGVVEHAKSGVTVKTVAAAESAKSSTKVVDESKDESEIDFKTTDELEKAKASGGEKKVGVEETKAGERKVVAETDAEGYLRDTASFDDIGRAIDDMNWRGADQNQALTCLRMLEMQNGLTKNGANNLSELFTEKGIADGNTQAEANWKQSIVSLLNQKQGDSLRALREGLNKGTGWAKIKEELAQEMFLYDLAARQPSSSAIEGNDLDVLRYNQWVGQKLQELYDNSSVEVAIAREKVGFGGGGTASK